VKFGIEIEHKYTYKFYINIVSKSTIRNMGMVGIFLCCMLTDITGNSINIIFKVVHLLNIVNIFMKSIFKSQEITRVQSCFLFICSNI
jgi:hypothetical protein